MGNVGNIRITSKTDVRKIVKDAIIKGIQRNGDRIFNTSQSTESCYVPRVTGFLAHSGDAIRTPNGIKLVYVAPYSSRVEFGGPAIPYTGTQTVHIKAHKRKSYVRKDGTNVRASSVKAHDVKYKNKRLIGFRPKLSKFERLPMIFRVLKEEKAREGQHFLGRATQKEIQHLSEDIEFYFRQLSGRAV